MSTRNALFTVRRRLLGLSLLMVIVLFFGFSIATYQRTFESTVDVVLEAASTGNQLMPDSDVKARGMVIGRVSEIRAVDGGAELRLALDPEEASLLPANVSARLLP
ncbi:MlaD family protein, partial [Saccharopolyspora sp. MS10]|uniref:MlaD family protein n=1 Tax=Saccharopolyspora sp. MS10 TaxID=3385973 RepID=UPI0039A3398C